jgi:hypothetical protein
LILFVRAVVYHLSETCVEERSKSRFEEIFWPNV